MSASRPTPVAAATVALERRRAVEVKTSSTLPTDAATVVIFGRPGLGGRGVPGLFAHYARKGVAV